HSTFRMSSSASVGSGSAIPRRLLRTKSYVNENIRMFSGGEWRRRSKCRGCYHELVTGQRRVPSWLPQVLGYGLSIGCLFWVLRGYDLRQLWWDFRTLDWRWMALAVVADLVVYVCHGWRWKTLLSPVSRLNFWRTVQAIYIGLFANEVLP